MALNYTLSLNHKTNSSKLHPMKKLLLTASILLFAMMLSAQQRASFNHERLNIPETREFKQTLDETPLLGQIENPTTRSVNNETETEIGETWYDLQTNSSLSNRIHRFEDGTIGAVWTQGVTSPPNFPDRGTGYNYYDGTSWSPPPATRVETVRTGWPSYAPLGSNGEIIVSHDFSAGTAGLVFNKRTTKGSGTWEEFTFTGPAGQTNIVWPRMTTAGTDQNSIHVIALTRPSGNGGTPYMGQDGALLYSRSTDAGLTWNIENVILPGLGSEFYTAISADDYVWAEANGNTIAFMIGSQWHDLVLMKSTDNGDNWTKTVIWEHPYPFFDWNTTITTDTLWAVDGSFSVALDNNGMAHVVFGLTRVAHTEPGTTYNYWPYTDGIVYWNEDMGPFPTNLTNPHWTLHADLLYESGHLVGWSQDVDGDGEVSIFDLELMVYRSLGISTMPDIHVHENNLVTLLFSSTTETFDDGTFYYKKLWARYSPDGGSTWSDFTHVTGDIMHMFDECIFPLLAGYENSNINIFFIYQADETPGLALDEDHPYQLNRMIFAEYPLIINPGIEEETSQQASNVSQSFPNPARDFTRIVVELKGIQKLTVEVFNMVGQRVETIDKGKVSGTQIFHLNTSEYDPGIYFYTVNSGNERTTGKMVVVR
jgi:hypothetical protein